MAWISATYFLSSTSDDVRSRAQALALEQSVELPLAAVRDARIREEIVARVAGVEPVENARYRVTLELAVATVGENPAQLLNMLFGNCSLQEDVELHDVVLPPALLSAFQGPRFGSAGVREITGVHGRPLTCTALKPQGSSPETLAELCQTFADAGIDVIKDDHGIADQRYAPFAERVRNCQAAIARARERTGKNVQYAPSLVGTPRQVAEQARVARDCGVRMVLVAPMLLGLPAFAEFAQSADLAILAHPSFGGLRVSPVLLFGKLFRLFGADAVIYPNYGGRFAYSADVCRALAGALRAPWDSLRPALPVPAGGMPVERTGEMVAFYGEDTMLLIGGSLLSAGDALGERSRNFVAAVEKAGA
ncbi:MAG: RuBisCO large subunit C-terminal-like domain-containing protein [Vulcanimicrobiaceae bacterium]